MYFVFLVGTLATFFEKLRVLTAVSDNPVSAGRELLLSPSVGPAILLAVLGSAILLVKTNFKIKRIKEPSINCATPILCETNRKHILTYTCFKDE